MDCVDVCVLHEDTSGGVTTEPSRSEGLPANSGAAPRREEAVKPQWNSGEES